MDTFRQARLCINDKEALKDLLTEFRGDKAALLLFLYQLMWTDDDISEEYVNKMMPKFAVWMSDDDEDVLPLMRCMVSIYGKNNATVCDYMRRIIAFDQSLWSMIRSIHAGY